MTRICWRSLTFALIFAALLNCAAARAQEVNFCSFALSKGILQAHTSFNVIYEFDVDQHGVPFNIKPVAEQFTRLKDVQSCVEHWSLPKSALKHLVAVFEWQHGIGWTKLDVSGPDIKLIIHVSDQMCPYATPLDDSKSSEAPPK